MIAKVESEEEGKVNLSFSNGSTVSSYFGENFRISEGFKL